MTRAVMVAFAFLTIGGAISAPGCGSSPVDRNFGTDAGADFDAPARDVPTDGAGEADGGADAGPIDPDAG